MEYSEENGIRKINTNVAPTKLEDSRVFFSSGTLASNRMLIIKNYFYQ